MFSNGLKKIDDSIRKGETTIVAFFIITVTVLIFTNVVLRYVFKNSWTWAEELTRYIIIWMTFIGASLCVRDNVHVTMDILINRISKRFKKPLLYVIYIGSAFISLYLTYIGWALTMKIKSTGQVSSAMDFLPMWLVYLCVPVGGILMAKNFIHLAILNFKSEDIIQNIKEGE